MIINVVGLFWAKYLTTQLIDMNVRMVVALNMYDELEASSSHHRSPPVGQFVRCLMVVPTVCKKKNIGVDVFSHLLSYQSPEDL